MKAIINQIQTQNEMADDGMDDPYLATKFENICRKFGSRHFSKEGITADENNNFNNNNNNNDLAEFDDPLFPHSGSNHNLSVFRKSNHDLSIQSNIPTEERITQSGAIITTRRAGLAQAREGRA